MTRGPAAGLLAAALLAGCGAPEPTPLVRVIEGVPTGTEEEATVIAAVRFSAEVAPEGIVDGRRLVLARAADLRAAIAAVDAEGGAGDGTPRVAAAVTLEEGGTRAVLRPSAPLEAGESWALVLSSRVRDPEGRTVLDAQGKVAPTIVRFATAAPPPPAVLLTEVMIDAATPEAGGEYAEVLNLGPGELDLDGWRLEKRSTAGSWSGCTAGDGSGPPVPMGGRALLVGGSWDGRYAAPPDPIRFACGGSALAGGIANDRAPVLRLLDRSGAVASIFDASGVPLCAGALERELDGGPMTCSAGTPGGPPTAP